MNEYYCLVFVRHEDDKRAFLFCVDPVTDMREGTMVMVNTIYGQKEARCVCDSFIVGKRAMNNLAKASGAYLPLKSVAGIIEYETVTHKVIRELQSDLPF